MTSKTSLGIRELLHDRRFQNSRRTEGLVNKTSGMVVEVVSPEQEERDYRAGALLSGWRTMKKQLLYSLL